MEYTATAAYRKPVASRNTTLSASIRMNFRKFRSRRDAAGISARTSPKQAIPATAVIAWAARTGTTSAASAATSGMVSRSPAMTITAHPRRLVRAAVDTDSGRARREARGGGGGGRGGGGGQRPPPPGGGGWVGGWTVTRPGRGGARSGGA